MWWPVDPKSLFLRPGLVLGLGGPDGHPFLMASGDGLGAKR